MNWYHQNVPKILGALSFLVNPIFIYLVVTKTKTQVGSYKNLLIMFSVFDILYSISEILTPLVIYRRCEYILMNLSRVYKATSMDLWFLYQTACSLNIQNLVSTQCRIGVGSFPSVMPY